MSATENYRDTLIQIIEKSATLAERLSGEFVPINDPAEAELIETRLNRWMQTAAQGDPERFRKRLEWDDLTLEQVKPLLGSVRRRDSAAPLPCWAEFLGEVLEIVQQRSLSNFLDTYHPGPITFHEILIPFWQAAWQHILANIPPAIPSDSEQLINDFLSHLGSQPSLLPILAQISTPTLKIALKTFEATISFPPEIASQQASYPAFVEGMFSGEMESFLVEYAVLARLLATATIFWIDSTAEIITRLRADYQNLQYTFETDGSLTGLKFGLSDPHHNGRTIALLSFANKQILYKPKSLATEVALNEWLNWLSADVPLKILEGENYGWMEYIEKGHFHSSEQISAYHQNAGIFLALIQNLAANDCHNGNIIYDGKHPVLIDAETLMHHRVPDIEYHLPDAGATAHAILENSVLRTQFLPKWELGGGGQWIDMSGLGTSANSLNDYETIINGFIEMYRFLLAHRDELLSKDSPLDAFKNQRVRYVFRPTQTYQTVLHHTLQPRYLHDGIDRSLQIESLNRVLLAWDEKPVFWDIHKDEAKAMEQMDVPLLTYNSSDTSLHIGDITIENAFDRPAFDLVIERLNSMSEEDLQRQVSFIRGSLFCRTAHQISEAVDEIAPPQILQNAPSREILISEALQIADELQAQAIFGEDGSATWITLAYHFGANRYQFGQISDGLYDGACGVAFFLAALHHVAGGPGVRELALAAIKPLQNRLHHPILSQRLARNLGINGPSGLKSIAYALRQISIWLDAPHLLDDIQRLESLITPEREAAKQKTGHLPENVFLHPQAAGRWKIYQALPEGIYLPGLYGGTAGIGYELLRQIEPSLSIPPF